MSPTIVHRRLISDFKSVTACGYRLERLTQLSNHVISDDPSNGSIKCDTCYETYDRICNFS